MRRLLGALTVVASLTAAAVDAAPARSVTLACTSSARDSGLLDHLLARFREASGIEVHAVARGTGEALNLGRRGDADVLLIHHRESEVKFVAEGHGVDRREVMSNDFVLVGPAADPAGIGGTRDAVAALGRIAHVGARFISRGDDSGTHKRELALWAESELASAPAGGGWYQEIGGGMGRALNMAAELDAYLLCDSATWSAFRGKRELAVLVSGDPRLDNIYSTVLVSPGRHPHVAAAEATALVEWLTSDAGRSAIASFQIDGRALFRAIPPVAEED